MNRGIFTLALVSLISLFSANNVKAQSFTIDPSADVVSSYIWRGTYCAGASLQPSMTASVGGFSLGAWGSTNLDNSYNEVDLSLGYSVGGFSLNLNDYWWTGMSDNYFKDHLYELSASFTISEDFPLSLSWSTMIAGPDKKSDDKQKFSTFIEASYPIDVAGVEFTPSLSVSPWESMYHRSGTSGFTCTTASLSAAKEIKITEKFSLPLFTQLIFAPNQQNCYFLVGISLL